MIIWNLPKVEFKPLHDIQEKRPVAVVYSGPAWGKVKEKLHLRVETQIEVLQATQDSWEQQSKDIIGEIIFGVGGGLAADAAKYFSIKTGLPMVCIPTALSVDAFFTWASGVRRDGCVYYITTKVPELVIIDLDVIAAAPDSIRAAGITDVLSIATGCWDWKFADERGRNPQGMEFIPWVYNTAQSILNGALDCAEAAGRGNREGLKTLYDCLAMEVQLCNQVGHARPEEGSEHYFAYCVENVMGHGLPHGDLVGPGIINAAEWQGQETQRLTAALRACNIPLDHIPPEIVKQTMRELPTFCNTHGLVYGISHELMNLEAIRL